MGSAVGSVETGSSASVLNKSDPKFSKTGGIIALGLTTITGVLAGIFTARSSRKKYEKYYENRIKTSKILMEDPYLLAFKALGWGTMWAVGGVSLLAISTCAVFGIKSMDDLRAKIAKNRGPVDSSTNFETFQDFLNYLTAEAKKSKSELKEPEVKS